MRANGVNPQNYGAFVQGFGHGYPSPMRRRCALDTWLLRIAELADRGLVDAARYQAVLLRDDALEQIASTDSISRARRLALTALRVRELERDF